MLKMSGMMIENRSQMKLSEFTRSVRAVKFLESQYLQSALLRTPNAISILYVGYIIVVVHTFWIKVIFVRINDYDRKRLLHSLTCARLSSVGDLAGCSLKIGLDC